MTKRDYVQFARMIRAERHKIRLQNIDIWENVYTAKFVEGATKELDSIVESLADMFQADNEHFNRAKFIQACQLPEKEKES